MKTDTSEKGLESLIMRHMTGKDGLAAGAAGVSEAASIQGGSGWCAGNDTAYEREFAVDSEQLFTFLRVTQPDEYAKLGIGDNRDTDGMARRKFLARLQGEIARREESFQHYPAAALQPGEQALAGLVRLHQRAAGDHL
jgi:type I restriction enzyme R subunit